MAIDDQLANLLVRQASLYDVLEERQNADILILGGTINDPNSFDQNGGKTGPLGYYPITDVNGTTRFYPCLARMRAVPLETVDVALAELDQAAQAKFAEVDDHVANAVGAFTGKVDGLVSAHNSQSFTDAEKAQARSNVGLSKADDTSDADKAGYGPIANAIEAARINPLLTAEKIATAGGKIVPYDYRMLSVPLNSTTNIYSALVAALNSGAKRIIVPDLPGRKHRIQLPLFSNEIKIPAGVELRGQSPGVGLYFDSINADGIINQRPLFTASGDDVSLVNLNIDGGSMTRGALAGFKAGGYRNVLISGVNFTNVYSQGIWLNSVTDSRIVDTTVNGMAYASLRIDGNSSNIHVEKFTAYSPRGFGVFIHDTAHDIDLINIRSADNGLETIGATVRTFNLRIRGGYSLRSGDNGISLTGYRCSVEGFMIEAPRFNGICLYGQSNKVASATVVNAGQDNVGKAPAAMLDYAAVSVTPLFGGMGRWNRIGAVVAIDNQAVATMQWQVQYKAGAYTVWSTGEAINTANDGFTYRTASGNIYRTTASGTAGSTAPSHTVGSVSDGGIVWEYVNSTVAYDDTIYPDIWAAGVVTPLGKRVTAGGVRYVATGAGTTGTTKPAHTSGAVNDGGVIWTAYDELPVTNFDAFDNIADAVSGTPGTRGYVGYAATATSTGNANAFRGPGISMEKVAGRNLYAMRFVQGASPVGNTFAPPGSTSERRDVNGNLVGLYVKDSGIGTDGWLATQFAKSGTTAQRPTLQNNNQLGTQFFDTTLAKPIFWNAGNPGVWRDATGTVV